jgi:ferredoxin-NADP reductase
MIKYALASGHKLRHTLIDSNKTWDDIIYRRELEELRRRHPGRLNVIHTLTRETSDAHLGPDVRKGRISLELLKECIPDPSAVRIFTCGPAITGFDRLAAKAKGETPAPRFLESVLGFLDQIGVKKEQIKRESYG